MASVFGYFWRIDESDNVMLHSSHSRPWIEEQRAKGVIQHPSIAHSDVYEIPVPSDAFNVKPVKVLEVKEVV